MTSLARSTSAQRNAVRVLVYGQSISEQSWWKALRDDLKARYPNADVTEEEKAIGGFDSPRLKRITPHIVLPYYPDLIVLHDYGNFAAIADLAQTGVNSVRVVSGTGRGADQAEERRAVVEEYLRYNIVPIVEDHMATCEEEADVLTQVVDRWLDPNNLAWLKLGAGSMNVVQDVNGDFNEIYVNGGNSTSQLVASLRRRSAAGTTEIDMITGIAPMGVNLNPSVFSVRTITG